ncbi:MAG: DNA repair protein RadC [Clostridia bacterium]|nr:DNA repair protein RadC [Clostridia bacterium]
MHEGHRDRMREKYLKNGMDALLSHEVLELLLFYSQPRVNTNETAHRLLDTFHSLNGVLDADPDLLCKVQGVGRSSAVFLHLLKDVVNLYNRGKLDPKASLPTAMDAGNYVLRLVGDQTTEGFYVFCLDPMGQLLSYKKIAEGSAYRVYIDIRLVVEYALRHDAFAVILAHNHPKGVIEPSEEDLHLTRRIQDAFAPLSISVKDHIIFGNGCFYSMAAHSLM